MSENPLRDFKKHGLIRIARDYAQACGAITTVFVDAKKKLAAAVQHIRNIGPLPNRPNNDDAIDFAAFLAL
jgi:hypothetical protein